MSLKFTYTCLIHPLPKCLLRTKTFSNCKIWACIKILFGRVSHYPLRHLLWSAWRSEITHNHTLISLWSQIIKFGMPLCVYLDNDQIEKRCGKCFGFIMKSLMIAAIWLQIHTNTRTLTHTYLHNTLILQNKN